MGVSEIYGSGPAEPAEKLQKFRIGWTPRAATKTTEIPDRLDPPSRHKNYKHSAFAGCCCCWLVVVACGRPRGPLRGQKVNESWKTIWRSASNEIKHEKH